MVFLQTFFAYLYIGLQRINLRICACSPAAVQLITQGLFPCAPLLPTLAVDIRVLELVSGIFLRMSPNNTAIASTLEDFLDSRGYKLQGEVGFRLLLFVSCSHSMMKDPLRRRFGNALLWFNTLQDVATKFLEDMCNTARSEVMGDHREVGCDLDNMGSGIRAGDLEHGDASESDDEVSFKSRANSEEPGIAEDEEDGIPNKRPRSMNKPPPLTRPSDYLRSRCPLCFGGKHTLAEGLVEFIKCLLIFFSYLLP